MKAARYLQSVEQELISDDAQICFLRKQREIKVAKRRDAWISEMRSLVDIKDLNTAYDNYGVYPPKLLAVVHQFGTFSLDYNVKSYGQMIEACNGDVRLLEMQARRSLVKPKGVSAKNFPYYYEGDKFLRDECCCCYCCRSSDVVAIGKMPPYLRYFVTFNDSWDYTIGCECSLVDWEAFKKIVKLPKWKLMQRPELPARVTWEYWAEMSPIVRWMKPWNISRAKWEEIRELDSAEQFPEVYLQMFYQKQYAQAMRVLYSDVSRHDAGQALACLSEKAFDEPQRSQWVALVFKTKLAALEYGGQFDAVQAYLGRVPSTLKELREAVAFIRYVGMTESTRYIGEMCSKFNLSQRSFNNYCKLFERPQADCTYIPYARVLGSDVGLEGQWSLERIATDDIVGPFLGLATNCCQHLDGAASSCAKKIWTNERSSALVVRYKGEIIAQSYIWVDGENLVIDSIESLSNVYVEGIAKLYSKAAQLFIGRFGIQAVWLGYTSYGITKQVCKLLVSDAEKIRRNCFKCPASYSDAGHIVRLV